MELIELKNVYKRYNNGVTALCDVNLTITNNGTEVKVNNKAPSTAGFKGNIKALERSMQEVKES